MAIGPTIGEAIVAVLPDFSAFGKAASAQIAKQENTLPGIEVAFDPDASSLRKTVAEANRKLESGVNDVTVNVEIDQTDVIAELKLLNAVLRDTGSQRNRSGVLRLSGAIGQLGTNLGSLIKMPAIIAGVGLFTQAIGAAGASLLALSAPLAYTSGLLIAYPAAALAGAQALGVFKLATAGVTDALGGLSESIDAEKFALLSAPAQDLTFALDAMKNPIQELQTELQEGLLPGVADSLRMVKPLMAEFTPALRDTSEIMGQMAQNTALFVANNKGDFQSILKTNNELIKDMGSTTGNLGQAFVDVLISAEPFLLFVTNGLRRFSEGVASAAQAGRDSGGTEAFFMRTRIALDAVLDLLGNVGRIFGATFRAGFSFGVTLLRELNDEAKSFARYLESAAGQRGLRDMFKQMMPAIREFGRLARDIVVAFGELAMQPGFVASMRAFRQELLPAILDLIAVTTKELLPVLIPALKNFVLLLTDISGTSGPLNSLVKIFGMMFGALHDLFTAHPWVLKLVVALMTFGTVAKGLQFVALIAGFSGLSTAISVLASAALKALVPALKAVGAALLANPVLAVIAGITALGIAMFVAYQKSETFRSIVQAVGRVLRGVFMGMINAGRSAIGFIQDMWARIKGFFQSGTKNILTEIAKLPIKFVDFFAKLPFKAAAIAYRIFKRFIGWIAKIPGNIPRALADLVPKMYEAGKDAGSALLGGLSDALTSNPLSDLIFDAQDISGGDTSKATEEYNRALENANNVREEFSKNGGKNSGIGWSKSFGKGITDALRAGQAGVDSAVKNQTAVAGVSARPLAMTAGTSVMQSFGMGMRNQIQVARPGIVASLRTSVLAFGSGASGTAANVGHSIMSSLWGGMTSVWQRIAGWLGGLAAKIRELKGPIQYDRQILTNVGQAVMEGFWDGLKTGWSPVEEWLSGIGPSLKGTVDVESVLKLAGGIVSGDEKDGRKKLDALVPPVPSPSTGYPDTLRQANILAKMFNVVISSGLRSPSSNAAAGGVPNSLHMSGLAIDFAGANANLDRMFAFLRPALGRALQELLWKVAGHFDHLHAGWKLAGFRARGGPVLAGEPYMIGERGPEVFVPQSRGFVMRNQDVHAMIQNMGRGGEPGVPLVGNMTIQTMNPDPKIVAMRVRQELSAVQARVRRR